MNLLSFGISIALFLFLMTGCESKVGETAVDNSEAASLSKASENPESDLELFENTTLKQTAPTCSGTAMAKFLLTQNSARRILCKDETRLAVDYKPGPFCQDGLEIKAIDSDSQWVDCDQLKVCGQSVAGRRSLASRGAASISQLEFSELPWGCEGKIKIKFADQALDALEFKSIDVSFYPPACPKCAATGEPTCGLCGEDPLAPTIEQVVVDNQDCNTTRAIVFAKDEGAGLHRLAYSFDSGETWQASHYKDFKGLEFSLASAKIVVRDRAGNKTVYQKALQAKATPCPCEVAGGDLVPHGSSVQLYKSGSVACSASCELSPAVRTCNNGDLSGDVAYSFARCKVEGCPSCKTPWGETIEHGVTVQAFNRASATCAAECESGSLSCNKGQLQGEVQKFNARECKFQHPSCDCKHGSAIVGNGQTLKVFAQSEVACGSSCTEGQVSCSLGNLSGSTSSTATSCSVKACKCITPGGALIDPGETVEVFRLSKMNCSENIKCEDSGNRIKIKCADPIKNQWDLIEGTGNIADFKYSSCSRNSCGCVHLNVFFRPSDPAMKVYKLEKANAPATCEAPGNFGKVTCKELSPGYFRAEGDTNTSTFKYAQCEDVTKANNNGSGMSDHNVGAGEGGGAGGGLGNDIGDGEGFRRRRGGGGGGGGGDGCDTTKPPFYCSAGFTAKFITDTSMCFLPFRDGYKTWTPTSELDIRQRVSPGGYITGFSRSTVACGDKCSKYMGLIRCDTGIMSGKEDYKYADCTETCP